MGTLMCKKFPLGVRFNIMYLLYYHPVNRLHIIIFLNSFLILFVYFLSHIINFLSLIYLSLVTFVFLPLSPFLA
jgi:hypothetical protein